MALFTDTTCKVDILILWIGVITVYYYFARRIYTYWDRRGFKTIPGTSYIFGHLKETFLSREFLGDAVARLYRSSSEPFIGIYTLFRPILLVRDPEIVRSILIKDFAHFNERSVHCDKDTDSFSSTLFSLPGAEWKSLRAKLTPAFTSGKLKAMFSTLVDCGHGLQNYLEKLADKGDILDVREISASHATNVIASVVFGIEVDTVNDPNNEFRICGRKIFEFTIPNAIRWFLYHTAPKLMSIFRVKTTAPSVEAFIRSVVKQNLEYREKNNICRKDLFQLMIQLRNTGSVQLDDHWETVIKGNEHQKAMTEEEIAAESFLFFLAGFETSSTTISFCMYELAKNPEIQQRVHNEIDKILEKHNGQITYESVSEMKYLEYCIDGLFSKKIFSLIYSLPKMLINYVLQKLFGSILLFRFCLEDV